MSTRTDTEKHLDAAHQCASGTPAESYNLRRAQVHALLDIADAIRESHAPTAIEEADESPRGYLAYDA